MRQRLAICGVHSDSLNIMSHDIRLVVSHRCSHTYAATLDFSSFYAQSVLLSDQAHASDKIKRLPFTPPA
jgi:hypothetical protein